MFKYEVNFSVCEMVGNNLKGPSTELTGLTMECMVQTAQQAEAMVRAMYEHGNYKVVIRNTILRS